MREPAVIGLIGGSGLENAFGFGKKEHHVATKYGLAAVLLGRLGGREVAFLPRHGPKHDTPPHRINHRSNILALQKLGVKRILSSTAVGSLSGKIWPGSVVVPDDLIDFSGLNLTFFDDRIGHTDMSEPFSQELRRLLIKSAKSVKIRPIDGGTYVCVRGPRYETPAEALAFRRMGGDVAGMTVAPEAILSREAGIEYATLASVTNFSGKKSNHAEVVSAVGKIPVPDILRIAISNL